MCSGYAQKHSMEVSLLPMGSYEKLLVQYSSEKNVFLSLFPVILTLKGILLTEPY
jgi:hypothetical protein